jgi:hypothetical protein
MLVGVVIFYRASYQLPFTALGLCIFGVFALLRPGLAFLYVPLTVPLYHIPKALWDERFGIRPEGIHFPLHEVILLVTVGAAATHWLYGQSRHTSFEAGVRNITSALDGLPALLVRHRSTLAPVALFLLAGTGGVLVASPEGRGAALREWRWLIVEPVLFSGLLHWFAHRWEGASPARFWRLALSAFVVGGALAGLIGVLQFLGVNLAPLLGGKVGFSDDRALIEGVQRVSSVYGHPNNLGLSMGRVWPLALSLLIVAETPGARRFFGLCLALSAGGLLVSFSKGALLGAAAAGALMVVWGRGVRNRGMRVRVVALVLIVLALVVAGGLVLAAGGAVERFNVLGESSAVRFSLWRSSLAMLRDHPLFGVGLDQFLRLYPQYMDPALVGTNEQYTSHPHNLLLDVWLRMGVAGVVAFVWLLVRFFRAAARRWQAEADWLAVGVAAALVAAVGHGLVDNFYFVPDLAVAFWLVGGICGFGRKMA